MKKISFEEFKDRVMAVQYARRIFVETGLTKNITHAFAAYQEILAEMERPVHVPSDTVLNENCPACGKRLRVKGACCTGTNIEKVCVECGWKSYLEP